MKFTRESSVFLDLVRGLSAQLVLIGHTLSIYNIGPFGREDGTFVMQNFGVVVFFILSGLLIAYSTGNKNGRYGFRDFFLDRFTRIYIAYIPALLLIVAIDTWTFHLDSSFQYKDNTGWQSFIANMFMLQDFPLLKQNRIQDALGTVTSFGSGRPLWTVAIEWWIYLFFGMLLYGRFRLRNLLFWALLLIVPLYNTAGYGLSIVWFGGVLLYYALKKDIFASPRPGLVIGLLLLAALVRLKSTAYQVYDVGFALLLAAAMGVFIRELQVRPQAYSGFFNRIEAGAKGLASYSFSLYLIHYSLLMLMQSMHTGMNPWLEMGLVFVVANLVSWLFAYCTELRYHQVRSYLREKINTIVPLHEST